MSAPQGSAALRAARDAIGAEVVNGLFKHGQPTFDGLARAIDAFEAAVRAEASAPAERAVVEAAREHLYTHQAFQAAPMDCAVCITAAALDRDREEGPRG